MKRKLPVLNTDQAAADFVEQADLTHFDLSAMKPTRFEFAPKEARVNMRLPGDLLAAVRVAAENAGMPYQRFIRQALDEAVNR